jgi:hypothetical protein
MMLHFRTNEPTLLDKLIVSHLFKKFLVFLGKPTFDTVLQKSANEIRPQPVESTLDRHV